MPIDSLRVMELQAEARERTLVSVESQTKRLQDLSAKAEAYNNSPGLGVSVNAEKEVNKLNSLITDKTEHSGALAVTKITLTGRSGS